MNKSKIFISFLLVIISISCVIAQDVKKNRDIKDAADKAADAAKDAADKIIDTIKTEPEPPANSTIRGRVFYADTGRPVKRSSIMLMREDGSGGPRGSESGLTNGEGYFEIKKVKAGTYYAMVNAPGVVSPLAYADLSRLNPGNEKEELTKGFEVFEKIVVDGMTDLDVQVAAKRGGAIGGRVMYDDGDPAIGVKVEILRKVEDKFIPVIPNFSAIMSMFTGGGFQTDDRGVFRFSGLPPGEYIVKVTENALHTDAANRRNYSPDTIMSGGSPFLSIFFPNVFESQSAQIINVQMGQELSETNIVIPSRNLYRVTGKIISKKDKSSVKARVGIKRMSDENIVSLFKEFTKRSGSGKALTDKEGSWSFKELPKGTYQLIIEPIAEPGAYDYYSGEYLNANRPANNKNNAPPEPKFAKTTREIVIADKDLDEVVIELGSGAIISGIISTENNQILPDSVVLKAVNQNTDLEVTSYLSANSYKDEKKNNKKSEAFKLENVAVGKTTLQIKVPETFYLKSASYKDKDLLAQEFTLSEGETLKNVRIILANDVGTLKGKLLDENKQPLALQNFTLIPTDPLKRGNPGFYKKIRTDKNGEFETKLAPFEFAVIFFEGQKFKDDSEKFTWLNEAIRDAKKIKIESGKTETVTINTY